jgi:hypothetical protein
MNVVGDAVNPYATAGSLCLSIFGIGIVECHGKMPQKAIGTGLTNLFEESISANRRLSVPFDALGRAREAKRGVELID